MSSKTSILTVMCLLEQMIFDSQQRIANNSMLEMLETDRNIAWHTLSFTIKMLSNSYKNERIKRTAWESSHLRCDCTLKMKRKCSVYSLSHTLPLPLSLTSTVSFYGFFNGQKKELTVLQMFNSPSDELIKLEIVICKSYGCLTKNINDHTSKQSKAV